jgi:glycosyltransferase involved in cell wall biosynthesis
MIVEGLVSTIIPVYNRPTLLQEAVASVLAQTYRPIEILIVNDGSTDDTGLVADELAATHLGEIHAFHITNGGPGIARETGRQAARGEFIQYLDSDDLLLPDKFTLQVASLCARPECGVAYGKTGYGQDMSRPWKRTGERIEAMFPSFLQARWWGTSTPLYRREVAEKAGPWENLRQEEDWVYDCRVAALGTQLCYIDQFLSLERDTAPDRLSGNATSKRYWQDRATAHRLIWECAQHAGIELEEPAMCHFARELFLLSRQCGAAGLDMEARELFNLAREASGPDRADGLDFRLYRLLAGLAGWERAGRLACGLDRWRCTTGE